LRTDAADPQTVGSRERANRPEKGLP